MYIRPFSLFLLLPSISTPILAVMFCFKPYFEKEPVPFESDCRYVLAHMPTLPIPNESNLPVNTIDFLSNPFLPPALFRHESCSITLTIVANAASGSETVFLAMLKLMREGTERIIDECVSDDDDETTGGRLHDAINPNLWYDVVVKTWVTPVELKLEHQQLASLQNGMQSIALGDNKQRFQYTYYDL